jgi:hypothetical protein
MAGQKLDPLDHGLKGHLPQWKLLLEILVACWGSSRKHKTVVGVNPHDRPVLPAAVPLTGANCHNMSNWAPSSELEVLGADQVRPLPNTVQHMEQLEEGD